MTDSLEHASVCSYYRMCSCPCAAIRISQHTRQSKGDDVTYVYDDVTFVYDDVTYVYDDVTYDTRQSKGACVRVYCDAE